MKLKFKTWMFLIGTLSLCVAVCCMKVRDIPWVEESAYQIEEFEWPNEKPVSSEKEKEKQLSKNHLESPMPSPKKRKFIRYEYLLEYAFSNKRYNTCYTGKDPGDPGHMKYGNINFADKLHKKQRIIKWKHNTVALCLEDKRYHEELIEFPDGTWTHKWRVHIDGVHKPYKDERKFRTIDDKTDNFEFAVPRDRMIQSKRIDYLITQAGIYNSVEQRVKNWKSIWRKCDFWEWRKYKLFDDGYLERVE